MTDMTFFWHDYETFGVVPRRDRPAQFAGIRTDADLNEVGAPVMLYCQQANDYLPDPQSCLITGILPQTCNEHGVPEHEFAAAIEKELALPGTVGVGYNTIRFDDEVTRHLFWRNLIDPYAREWQNQCGRWDLLDVVRCAYALRPEGINWPLHQEGPMAGRVSFKLEHLSAANNLAHEAAHDALSDVRATIALARLIKTQQPKLFEFCLKLRKKDAVMDEIGVGRPFLHVSGMFGPERGCIALVWPLAPHPTNKNEIIVWDLSVDPSELLDLNAADIRTRMFTRQDELPDGVMRLPIKSIHINKSPIVIGNLRTLKPEMAQRWGLDMDVALRHAEIAMQRGYLLKGLWADVFERETPGEAPDVDENLYGGFVSPNDRRTLNKVREMSSQSVAESMAERRINLDDERLEEILFRYRARNFPTTLDANEQLRWQEHRHHRLIEGQAGWLTLHEQSERIDALSETADERGEAILGALVDYAELIAP